MSLAALLWAAILLLAAAGKLGGAPVPMLRAMRDLGLPAPLMRPLVANLHLAVQLIIGAGLIIAPAPWAWIFSVAGMLLAITYLVLVWGRRGYVCRCIGDTPQTITGVTVLRSILLLILAIMSLGGGGIWDVSLDQWPALVPLLGAVACEAAARRRKPRR